MPKQTFWSDAEKAALIKTGRSAHRLIGLDPTSGYASGPQHLKIQKHLMQALIEAGGHPSIFFQEVRIMFRALAEKMPTGSNAQREGNSATISAQVAAESFITRWQKRARSIKQAGLRDPAAALESSVRTYSLHRDED